MDKPLIEFISDGRKSKVILLGNDISKCVNELHIKASTTDSPLDVEVEIKLNRLDLSTPADSNNTTRT